jgi:hypothetical protein
MTSQPRKKAVRATALAAAFIPGASPPLVEIPILNTSLLSLSSHPIMQEPGAKHVTLIYLDLPRRSNKI